MLCDACPLECGADRSSGPGSCGVTDRFKVSNIQLHHWEEPPISGTRGSGTVFFSHCNLCCRFCQNYTISQLGLGRVMSEADLESAILGLADQGAHNINLVTPTQYTDMLQPLLTRIVPRLSIPVVWNSNGYEKPDRVRRLAGLVQVWLPDLKYHSDELALACSSAPRYFEYASAAIREMHRQVGRNEYDADGIIRSGLIIRHLILPGQAEDSIRVLDWIARKLGTDITISLMAQYYPTWRARELPGFEHRLRPEEYRRVTDRLHELGFENGFTQELSSAGAEYTPDFGSQPHR